MIRKITRLAKTSPAEWRFRLLEKAHVVTEGIRFAAGPLSWPVPLFSEVAVASSARLYAAAIAIGDNDRRRGGAALAAHFAERKPRFALHPGDRLALVSRIQNRFPGAAANAADRARMLIEGKYDLLGYKGLTFQSNDAVVDWQFDPVSGRRPPPGFWSRVPYLDPEAGDHKVIWELNRHQHWLTLGRAAWLAPSPEYSTRFRIELDSWLRHNPPYAGVNWSSMLELAFRSLSWLWALHFFADDDPDNSGWLVDMLGALQMQLDHVARHLSQYFSPNTHLLGEGLALYVAGRALPELAHAARWATLGREVLVRESRVQVHPDGGHAEQSLHYHLYALDFYLLALVVARRTDDPSAAVFAATAARMARFCRAMVDDSGRLPTIGDDDGGALFPICGRQPCDAGPTLSLAATLLADPSLSVRGLTEEVLWMTAGDEPPPADAAAFHPSSILFPDTGYLSLRSPNAHAIVDAGPHGFLNGGHAHADALALTLSINGRQLLIDPGTATYVMDPAVRDRFRSTTMHNTLVLDGQSQSQPDGPFHWATRTDATIVGSHLSPDFDYLEAQHSGFSPVTHRRAILRTGDLWIVADHLLGAGTHAAQLHWHLDPAWTLRQRGAEPAYVAESNGDRVVISCTTPASQLFSGDEGGLGWYAPVYGAVVRSPTIRFSQSAALPFSLITMITTANSGADPTDEVVHADGDSGRTVVIRYMGERYLAIFGAAAGASDGRSVEEVTVEGDIFSSDAVVTLLRLSTAGEPVALHLINGTKASWTGAAPFRIELQVAKDLHLDSSALRQFPSSPRVW
ncbi:MAG: alginate lyase family protein [Vicinamibacterales bacterium]